MQQSITRVVKLTLQPQHIQAFKTVFASHKMHIAQFDGCIELNAYQDNKQPEVFFTISRWQSEHNLDNYRYSDFFKTLWSVVKPMFAAKAEAYSMTVV
jgi:quinol monooxygenase YgiN